jgi:hypothetical protein
VITHCDNSFISLPDRLKLAYLHLNVNRHAQGHPSVFSTLIYRSRNLALTERNISPTDTDEATVSARQDLLRELVDQVDLGTFHPNLYRSHYPLFNTGRLAQVWLEFYDQLFQNVYSDVRINLGLFFLLLCWQEGAPFLVEKVRKQLLLRVPQQWRFAYTHDLLNSALITESGMFKFVFPLLREHLKHVSLASYIERAVVYQPNLGESSAAIAILKEAVGNVGQDIDVHCYFLGRAILDAQLEGETEVSAIIAHRISKCTSFPQLDVLFKDVFGVQLDSNGGHRFTMERMDAVKQQARYKLIWQRRCRKPYWRIFSWLYNPRC